MPFWIQRNEGDVTGGFVPNSRIISISTQVNF